MKLLLILTIPLLLLLAACGGPGIPQAEMEEFAKCITAEGAVMYGAFWCPHCAKTKKKFGESFKHVKYVECDPRGDDEQSELCIEKQIDKYDTWEFADGSRIVSEPTLEDLAEKTGCPLPEASA